MSMPTKFTDETQHTLVTAVRSGILLATAAKMADVSRATLHAWLASKDEKYQSFQSEIRKAQGIAGARCEMDVYKADPKFWLLCGPGRERYNPDGTVAEEGWARPGTVPPIREKKPCACCGHVDGQPPRRTYEQKMNDRTEAMLHDCHRRTPWDPADMDYVPTGFHPVEPPPADPEAAEAELERALYESRARDVREAELAANPTNSSLQPSSPANAGWRENAEPNKHANVVAMAQAMSKALKDVDAKANQARGVKHDAKPAAIQPSPSAAADGPNQAQRVQHGAGNSVARAEPQAKLDVSNQARGVKNEVNGSPRQRPPGA